MFHIQEKLLYKKTGNTGVIRLYNPVLFFFFLKFKSHQVHGAVFVTHVTHLPFDGMHLAEDVDMPDTHLQHRPSNDGFLLKL